MESNNLPDLSPHDLRHSCATLLLASGADIKSVQEIMGHKNIQTTLDIYADATEEAKKESMVRLSEKLDVF